MLFPTTDFAMFFGVVFVLSWLLSPHPRRWKLFMIAASYFFYGWWDWRFVFLLAASTTAAHLGALAIHHARTERSRKRAMIVSVAANLGFLGWFKYYGFAVVSLDNFAHALGVGRLLPLLQITLPVGISFFTFMAISYVVDVYRGVIQPAAAIDTAVYLSFFPHIVAGPIVRGPELLPQIRAQRDPSQIDLPSACYLIFGGLFKKVVISSYVSTAIVNPVFDAPRSHTALEILFAVYGYAVQIYADFSGYTDMAIGIAMLLGLRLPQNFDAPYAATTLQDFWRRWHMTLSRWLRDYLYIPLGGSHGSEGATYRNIMITMVLGGLWHGAAWTFAAWGAVHGTAQVVGHRRRTMRKKRGEPPIATGRWRSVSQRLATFHVVCLGWVFFRADSFTTAWTMLERLFTAFGPAPLVTPMVVITIAFGIATQYVPGQFRDAAQRFFAGLRPAAQGALLGAILLVITTLGPAGVAPFIYYRF